MEHFEKRVRARAIAAGLAAVVTGAALAGCSVLPGLPGQPPGSTATPIPPTRQPSATPAPAAGAAPTDRPAPTFSPAESQVVLIVWMPDTLYEANDAPGKQAFLDQLAAFDQQHPEIQVQVLAKRLRGPGGTLNYLRSAPPVAPSVVPDMVLVDRDAEVEAQRAQLVVPIQTLARPSSLDQMYSAALVTGTVDDVLTGVPYLLEVDHAVYRQSVITRPPQTFANVLDQGQFFAFAGGVSSGVSPVFLLQYLAAGGTLVDDKGAPAIDTAVLSTVLDFYAQAKLRRIVTAEQFQLPDTAAAWAMYRDRQTNLVAVTSTQYLAGLPQVTFTRATAIPTQDGRPIALARGWTWLLVAHTAERQAAALALLNFLMAPANQGRYSQAVHYLPTQPAALALWDGPDSSYPAFADGLLKNAVAMPDAAVRTAVGVAMQDALEAVVLNNVPASQAASRAAAAIAAGPVSQP